MSNLLTLAAVSLTASNQPISIQSLPPISVGRDWIDFATLAVSVILMVIGGIGVCAAIRTLNAVEEQAAEMVEQATLMKEQTAVAQKAADAALLNAQAVINAERPWFLIEEPSVTLRGVTGTGFVLEVTFRATNVGRSPAEIIHSATDWKTFLPGQQIQQSDAFFSESTPNEVQWAHTQWKAPGEAFSPERLTFTSAESSELLDMLKDGTRVLIVMGFVRYRDAISFGIHESRFCYSILLKPRSIVMTGPPGYNRLT